ncbi:MAG: cytochrome c biogenesis protein CcsA [bacterium]|nr:cytochrome c biogenesis protein CcsA [bacterium]
MSDEPFSPKVNVSLSLFFWTLFALITLGWVLSCLSFFKDSQRSHRVGERLLFVGLVFQLVYAVASYIELGLDPFSSTAGLFLFGSLLVLTLYFVLDFYYTNQIFEVIFPPLTLFFLLLSDLVAHREIGTEGYLSSSPVFGKVILIFHASNLMVGYLLFAVACVTSIFYLYQEHQLKAKTLHLRGGKVPSLGYLDKLNYKVIAVGFLLVTFGLLSGVGMNLFANSGGMGVNLRQGLPVATWAIYAVFLLDRSIEGMRGKASAIWAISGFIVVALSFAYEISILLAKSA